MVFAYCGEGVSIEQFILCNNYGYEREREREREPINHTFSFIFRQVMASNLLLSLSLGIVALIVSNRHKIEHLGLVFFY